MKLPDYIYYIFYKLQIQVGNGGIALLSATFLFALIFLMNVTTFFIFIHDFTNIHFNIPELPKPVVGGATLIVFAIFYVIFVSTKRYKSIISKYESESKTESKNGTLFILSYLIGSFVLLFSSFYFSALKNSGLL